MLSLDVVRGNTSQESQLQPGLESATHSPDAHLLQNASAHCSNGTTVIGQLVHRTSLDCWEKLQKEEKPQGERHKQVHELQQDLG